MKRLFTLFIIAAVAISFAQTGSLTKLKQYKKETTRTHRVTGQHKAKNPSATYLYESFEVPQMLPPGWSVDGFLIETEWGIGEASAYGVGSFSLRLNYDYNDTGIVYSLISADFLLAEEDSLTFDHAYATKIDEDDKLEISYSTNMGETWTVLALLHGGISGELVTAPPQEGSFEPADSQWATKTFPLPAGTNKLKFSGISAGGNTLYLDNIRVGAQPQRDAGVYMSNLLSSIAPMTFVPKAVVRNYGTEEQDIPVTLTITPGGYTSTRNVTLAPYDTMLVAFDDWDAAEGEYMAVIQTALAGDQNFLNNTYIRDIIVSPEITLSQTVNPRIMKGNTVACHERDSNVIAYTGDNSFYRAFTLSDYGIDSSFRVTSVQFGVDTAYSPQDTQKVTVFLYSSNRIFPFGYPEALVPLDSAAVTLANQSLGTITVPFDVVVPDSAVQLIVEVRPRYEISNHTIFFIGANNFGETGASFITTQECGIGFPMALSDVGMGMDFIINVSGRLLSTPVELTSFTAAAQNDDVVLNWQTATETNNKGFEVQKLIDGKFTAVSFINGSGTTTEKQSYTYTDKNVTAGKLQYRLKQIDFDGTYKYSNTVEVNAGAPGKFSLSQNYPNPFNPSTVIEYSVPQKELVNISVYNVLGKKIMDIVNDVKDPGSYKAEFNGKNLSSGVYFYKLSAGSFTRTMKMILAK